MTTYLVFRRPKQDGTAALSPMNNGYERMGKIDAHGALAALRKAGEQWGDGRYAAVPESRWTEETVGVETIRRITVGGVGETPEPQA